MSTLTQELSGRLRARYRVVRELGRGGMGCVYEAVQVNLDRRVALKVLRADQFGDQESRQRFLAEAKILSRLSHANIVTLLDAELDGLCPVIVMEYVEGDSLERLIRARGRLTLAEALGVSSQLLGGLVYLHEQGVVHRDLKPENILVKDGLRPKLADFGLALAEGAGRVTAEGFMVGTPMYMSPEQLNGAPPAAAADVYAFGVTLFRMLTGGFPFPQASAAELALLKLSSGRAVLEAQLEGPAARLSGFVSKCLAPDPRLRFATAKEAERALAEAGGSISRPSNGRPASGAASRSSKSRRVFWVGLTAGALAASAATLWLRGPRPGTAAAALAPPRAVVRRNVDETIVSIELARPDPVSIDVLDRGRVVLHRDLPAAASQSASLPLTDDARDYDLVVSASGQPRAPPVPMPSPAGAVGLLAADLVRANLHHPLRTFAQDLLRGVPKAAVAARMQALLDSGGWRKRMAKVREAAGWALGPEYAASSLKARWISGLDHLLRFDLFSDFRGLGISTGVRELEGDSWKAMTGEPPPGRASAEVRFQQPRRLLARLVSDLRRLGLGEPDATNLDVPIEVPVLSGARSACLSVRGLEFSPDGTLTVNFHSDDGEYYDRLLLPYVGRGRPQGEAVASRYFDPRLLPPGKTVLRFQFAALPGELATYVLLTGVRITLW